MAILDSFFNTLYGQDRISGLEAKYGTGSSGQPSTARHQSAVSQLNQNLNISPTFGPGSIFTSGIASIGEIPDVMKTGDIKESLRDIRDNFIGGTLTKTPEQIYEDIYGVGSVVDPNATAMMPLGTIISGAKGIFGGKGGAAIMKKMGKDLAMQKAAEKIARQQIEKELAERALKAQRERARAMGFRGSTRSDDAQSFADTQTYGGGGTRDDMGADTFI